MKAMAELERRDAAYYEARRICDRRDIDDPAVFENIARGIRHRSFMKAVQPFLKAKASLTVFAMPVYSIHANGTMTITDDGLTADQRETMGKIDNLIEQIRRELIGDA